MAEIVEYFDTIKENRDKIAELMHKIHKTKAGLWEEASGTVDAKKDYIKSVLADEYKEIALCEAKIEYAYNMSKLEFNDE